MKRFANRTARGDENTCIIQMRSLPFYSTIYSTLNNPTKNSQFVYVCEQIIVKIMMSHSLTKLEATHI